MLVLPAMLRVLPVTVDPILTLRLGVVATGGMAGGLVVIIPRVCLTLLVEQVLPVGVNRTRVVACNTLASFISGSNLQLVTKKGSCRNL